MPEGPEVRVMTDNIRMIMGDDPVLVSVEVIKDNFVKRTSGFPLALPQKVTSVQSKGKFTYIQLHNGMAIGITYGMTGNIRSDEDNKHNVIKFVCGNAAVFYYHSTRHFGHVWGMSTEELSKKLSSLGHDILSSEALSVEDLVKIWRKKNNLNICRLLIEEQGLVAGIGNYIKSEILYRARVYPFCTASDLTDEVLYSLYVHARDIAAVAYIDGGASLYTYTGLNGERSPFKLKLQVYDRAVDPDGNPITRVETPDKRTTHWVPVIQKIGCAAPMKITLKPHPAKSNTN